jgi:ribonuclease Z
MNRLVPLRIWGPNGSTPELGTAAAMENMKEMYVWDIGTRSGVVDFRGGELEVNEFAFDGVNEVIYNENGVVIRSIPAVHGLDGAVSFILEWNGLTFAYSSDTVPNQWWIDHTKGADIAIHECFLPPTLLVTKQGFAPLEALTVGTQGHTSPEQFGKVMSLTEPRLAVGYHFYNDFDVEPEVRDRVRKTYGGPLELAVDYMVFNVTRDDIKVRMSAIDEEIWPNPPMKDKIAPDFTSAISMSDFTLSGVVPLPEVVGPIYDEINELYGTDFAPGLR